jgi:hypothetical protein
MLAQRKVLSANSGRTLRLVPRKEGSIDPIAFIGPRRGDSVILSKHLRIGVVLLNPSRLSMNTYIGLLHSGIAADAVRCLIDVLVKWVLGPTRTVCIVKLEPYA